MLRVIRHFKIETESLVISYTSVWCSDASLGKLLQMQPCFSIFLVKTIYMVAVQLHTTYYLCFFPSKLILNCKTLQIYSNLFEGISKEFFLRHNKCKFCNVSLLND